MSRIQLPWRVTEKQMRFLDADSVTEVLFGGAAGGGKSHVQLMDAFLYACKYKGSKQLILRRTYPELEMSLIQEHLKLYPKEIYKYNETKHRGRLKNGSVITFGSLQRESDVYKYQGAEFDVIRFDELTHFTWAQYSYLLSRVRGTNNFPKQIKSSTNPGGVGHQWVKARFIDPAPPETVFDIVEKEGGTVSGQGLYLPAKVQENIFLMEKDPDYLKRLLNLPEKKRMALLEGRWDIYDGVFFTEFDPAVHVVRPFRLPEHWKQYVTMDYGMDMLAVEIIAVDEDGNGFVHRELYESGLIISRAAEKAAALAEGLQITAWLAPPDLWSGRQETGKSVADIFAEHGIPLTMTSNNRHAGWMAVREWLATRTVKDAATGEERLAPPRLRIFENCRNLIRTLPALQFDDRDPEDVANEPHELTHAPDALRGFCIYWVTGAQKPKKKGVHWEPDMWEDYRAADPAPRKLLEEKWGKPER